MSTFIHIYVYIHIFSGEKLAAAVALCQHQSSLQDLPNVEVRSGLLLLAMQKSINESPDDLYRAGLSTQDVFYSRITDLPVLLENLEIAELEKLRGENETCITYVYTYIHLMYTC